MKPFQKKRTRRLLFYAGAVLTGLILLSPFLISWGINTLQIKNRIAAFLYQKTGIQMAAERFSFALFPRPGVSIHPMTFNPAAGIDITIDFLKLDFDYQHLLQGKINIHQITVDRPEIKFTGAKGEAQGSFLDISLCTARAAARKIFTFFPDHQGSVALKFKNAGMPYVKRMDGSLYLSKEKQEIQLTSTLKKINFRPDTLSNAFFKQYPNVGGLECDQLILSARINAKGEIKGSTSLAGPKLFSPEKTVLLDANDIESTFKLSDKGCRFVISPFNLKYPKGRVGIFFENNPDHKKTILQFTGTQIHIDPARQMTLTVFKDNDIVKDLFQIIKAGIAPNVVVSFHGKDLKDLFDGKHLSLKGNIENGSVHIPETNLMATQVNGQAQVHDGILDIQAQTAMIQNSKLTAARLSIDLLNHENVPFQGDFSLDLDLSQVPQTLISLLPDTSLARELSLVHDVTGRTNAQLSLLLAPGSTDLQVAVTAPDFSCTGYYDRVPGPVFIDNTHFTYKPDQVLLKQFNARINGIKLHDGHTRIFFKDKPRLTVLSGSADIDIASVMPGLMSHEKIRHRASAVSDATGRLHVDSIDLSGPLLTPEQWKYDLTGSGSRINMITQSNQKQIQNLSGRFHLSNDLFKIHQASMKLQGLSWIKNWMEKKYRDSILVPVDLKQARFQMGANGSFLKTDLFFPTGPKIHIDLMGKSPAELILNKINISDKGISNVDVWFNSDKNKPVFDFKGSLNTVTLKKIIRPDSFAAKQIEAFTRGEPIFIQTDKESGLTITTRAMDLDAVFPQLRSAAAGRPLFPDKPIHFKADQVKFKERIITHVDTLLLLKTDFSSVQMNKAVLCDIETNGYLNVKKDGLEARFQFTADQKNNIQDLFTCLLKKNKFMDGPYSLTGNIHGKGPEKEFLDTLTGSVLLTAQKGRIYKLTLISRILSVLNVSKIFKGKIPDVTQNGFAYHKIFMAADIRDSKLYLSRAIIDGQDMTLIFSGWIDPLNDTLDLTCLVAPFKTVDLIIEKIPIVSTLLSGRLVTVPAKATGKLSDPVVVPLHPSAVGDGLITMMSDILKTPVKLWDKIYGE